MADVLDESIHREIDRYLLNLLPARDPVLARMEKLGLERGFPFIGPLVGQLLQLLTRAAGAKRVLELGSGFGYSAMHIARALPEDGLVVCTDGDSKNALAAEEFFREAGMLSKLEFHVGDALTEMDKTSGLFDVMLMDLDKESYPEGFQRAWPRLRVGGLFIADNLLWHGRVLTGNDEPSTRGVREFTRLIYHTPGAHTSIFPLRDGVSVTLKTA
ncbi:MAG: O-methyltransferase [bacterium]|nr:O-methyltransferase [bacterium]